MKTAVSVPNDVFKSADRLAKRLGRSRSWLYSEAVAEFVARRAPDSVTESMDRVAAQIDTRPDPALARAAHRTLRDSEW
jgi:metal-responsive CopG/Arc/MetJ family transcriptional regulator